MQSLDSNLFRLYLQDELLRRCKSNPRYSLRAFSKALGIDPPTLSKILRGKRSIGPKTITGIGLKLGLSPEKISAFQQKTQGSERPSPDYHQLTLDTFQIISDWYHYAILELLRVDHFQPSIVIISKALGIGRNEANAAIERLTRVGMLEITSDGKWVDLTGGTSTTIGNAFSAAAFRNLQKQVLSKAIDAVESIPFEIRDQTSVTMAVDSSRVAEAKEKIKLFRRELSTFLSRGESRDQVYNLSVSLYPLTQLHKKKGKKS